MKTSQLSTILLLIGSMLALLIPAFINGYPIVYSDTSTYIASGFDMETPMDRPITYGLFLRLFSFNGLSLWTVIAAQSLLVAILIFWLVKELLPASKYKGLISFSVIVFLSLFSSVSWTASQLMPDIFTPIMVLSAVLILIAKTSKKQLVFLYFLFFLATAMHMSHVSFNIIFLIVLLVIRWLPWFRSKKLISLRPLIIMLALSLASILLMGSALSKSRHVFFMGALVEHGIAKKYLDEHCDEKDYKLCEFKDEFPKKAWQFVWEESSPLYKVGGWKGSKQEFNEIINGTLTSPRFIILHIRASAGATLQQFTLFRIGDGNGVFLGGTLLHERIARYFPGELSSYENSLQNQDNLWFINTFNIIQQIVVVLSVILLLVVLILNRKSIDNKLIVFILMIVLAILINAWVCATFANAIDRLGSKMMWLLPFAAAIVSLKLLPTREQ